MIFLNLQGNNFLKLFKTYIVIRQSFISSSQRYFRYYNPELINRCLQPFQGVSPALEDVLLHVHPKGKDHVNNERRTQCEEGDVDEP